MKWAIGVLVILWSVQLFVAPHVDRDAVGASATTVFSRAYAHFTAPFFHTSYGHIAYNSLLILVGVTLATRALGARAVLYAFGISVVTGILVDVVVVLPLAAAGSPAAVAAAPVRLVGASVFAFGSLGLGLKPKWGLRAIPVLAAYEAVLALTGVTQGFVWCYHLTGFVFGVAFSHAIARASRA